MQDNGNAVDLSQAKTFSGKILELARPYWFTKAITPFRVFWIYILLLAVIVLSLEIPTMFIVKRDMIIAMLGLDGQSGWIESWKNISFEHNFRQILLTVTPDKYDHIIPTQLVFTEFYIQSIWFTIVFSACYIAYKLRNKKLTTQKRAAFLLLFNVFTTIYSVKILVFLANWYRLFYNALQGRDENMFWQLITLVTPFLFLYISVLVIQLYYRLYLQVDWRRFMTQAFDSRWLNKSVYYQTEVHDHRSDNPDQRISEDIDRFTSSSLDLSLGLFKAIYTLFAFLFLLWNFKPDGVVGYWSAYQLAIPQIAVLFDGQNFVEPHNISMVFFRWLSVENIIGPFMVVVAFVYAILGTIVAHLIARPLIKLFFQQQHYEADFRYSLIRIRENAEGIALYRGEQLERKELDLRFGRIWYNYWQLVKYQKRLLAYRSFYGQLAVLFPFVVASPIYFPYVISFGAIFILINSFGEIRDSFSWFIDNYQVLASWKSVVDRLLTFEDAMTKGENLLAHNQLQLSEGYEKVEFNNLNVMLDDGSYLFKADDITINPGEKILITGPSGAGKSTLIRTIAGIWPYASGEIKRPAQSETLFVPQKLYLPLGSLKNALCYPSDAENFEDSYIENLLQKVNLSHIIPELHDSDNWLHRLSPGEQQRLAAVRIVLNKPKWLFLDEATSALDEGLEYTIYSLITAELTDSTIISVAHKSSVRSFHQIELRINTESKILERFAI